MCQAGGEYRFASVWKRGAIDTGSCCLSQSYHTRVQWLNSLSLGHSVNGWRLTPVGGRDSRDNEKHRPVALRQGKRGGIAQWRGLGWTFSKSVPESLQRQKRGTPECLFPLVDCELWNAFHVPLPPWTPVGETDHELTSPLLFFFLNSIRNCSPPHPLAKGEIREFPPV